MTAALHSVNVQLVRAEKGLPLALITAACALIKLCYAYVEHVIRVVAQCMLHSYSTIHCTQCT